MKAVVLEHGVLTVDDVPAPSPAVGQVLVDVRRNGICGSDLHARTHGDELADVLRLCGYDRYLRSDQRVILGHEIYGVVADFGPWTESRLTIGQPVVSVPVVRRGREANGVGLSTDAPGGYAEQVVLQESFTMPVPNGLSPDIAALTEPMAVGWHAVNRAEIGRKDAAIVLGCGPVGLAVIAVLRARGVETIIASDYSPGRRRLATAMGASVVVDPAVESPWDSVSGRGYLGGIPDEVNAGLDAMDTLGKLPLPWWTVWRTLDRTGRTSPARPVVFECVGVPGMIDAVMADAPMHTRVVVVGVCMGEDRVRPALAINKELDLRFVVGYSPLEFRDTLHALADGKLDAAAMVTGHVGLDGVAAAFDALGDPETHAKILIDPSQTSSAVTPVAQL